MHRTPGQAPGAPGYHKSQHPVSSPWHPQPRLWVRAEAQQLLIPSQAHRRNRLDKAQPPAGD